MHEFESVFSMCDVFITVYIYMAYFLGGMKPHIFPTAAKPPMKPGMKPAMKPGCETAGRENAAGLRPLL